jgi:hypothetical protein
MKRSESDYPYSQCEKCKDIGDCPAPDLTMDGMSSPLPPEVCLKPIDVMNATLKKRKKNARDIK